MLQRNLAKCLAWPIYFVKQGAEYSRCHENKPEEEVVKAVRQKRKKRSFFGRKPLNEQTLHRIAFGDNVDDYNFSDAA